MIDFGGILTGIAALIAVLISAYSVIQARRAKKGAASIETRKVDASAYDRAQKIYESSIHQLEQQIGNLANNQDRIQRENTRLQELVYELRAYQQVLVNVLRTKGIDVPTNPM